MNDTTTIVCPKCDTAFDGSIHVDPKKDLVTCPSCNNTVALTFLKDPTETPQGVLDPTAYNDPPQVDLLKQAFEENPVTVRVNFGTEGVTYGVEQVVFDPQVSAQQFRHLRNLGILPDPGLEPYVTVEVVRNTKGYNWTAKVGNARDVDTAIRMLWEAETKLRVIYSEGGPALDPANTHIVYPRPSAIHGEDTDDTGAAA